jgi:23S rRNA (cytidine1920-2'-O)/16S rRNA (cytidine1409-2'-O)-methyltransferase
VRRGLAPSREQAQRLIAAGRVTVGGAPAAKAARQVDAAEAVQVSGDPPRYVGRGGLKLEAALEAFHLDVDGLRALDAGSSTGGFVDCLLQHGAAEVVAVDVGRAQLHERLRADPRVQVWEQTDIRRFEADQAGGPVDLVVADLAFISLRSVLPALLAAAAPGADLVLLVKPQFEAGRQEASRGKGVITDPAVWRRVLAATIDAVTSQGATIMGCVPSPLTGADGNVEFLLHAREGSVSPAATVIVDDVVAAAGIVVGGGRADDRRIDDDQDRKRN